MYVYIYIYICIYIYIYIYTQHTYSPPKVGPRKGDPTMKSLNLGHAQVTSGVT